MSTVYLMEQGSKVGIEGQRIVVVKDKNRLLELPLHKIERICIFGNVQVSTQLMTQLMSSRTGLSFFSQNGRFRGSVGGPMPANAAKRISQVQAWQDREFRLQIARQLIHSKIENMKIVLKRYEHNHPGADFQEAYRSLESGSSRLEHAREANQLMGIEGYCARIYFQQFPRLIRSEMPFPGRKKHPSLDPVNAMLSFGYALLGNEIAGLLEGAGLDPYLGMLHEVRYGRKSLALDLLEEFRQAIIDPLVIRMVNLRIMLPADFEPGENGLVLKREALRRFLQEYEMRMNSQTGLRECEPEAENWRVLLRSQAEQLGRSIVEMCRYQPHKLKGGVLTGPCH